MAQSTQESPGIRKPGEPSAAPGGYGRHSWHTGIGQGFLTQLCQGTSWLPSPVTCFSCGHFSSVFGLRGLLVWSGWEIVALIWVEEEKDCTKGLFCSIFSADRLDGLFLVLANSADLQERRDPEGGGDLSLNCSCLQYKQLSCSSDLLLEKKKNKSMHFLGDF